MLLGYEVEGQAQELIAYGADVVLCADERELVQYNTEPYAQAITQIVRERKPSIVLIGATTNGQGWPSFIRPFRDRVDSRLYGPRYLG